MTSKPALCVTRLRQRKLIEASTRYLKSRAGKKVPALMLDFCGDLESLQHTLSRNDASGILKIEGTPLRQLLPERAVADCGKAPLRRWRSAWFWKIWFADRGKL
jgi:hypothetical protein